MLQGYPAGVGFSPVTLVLGLTALALYALGLFAAWNDHPWLALVCGFAGGMTGSVAAALFALEWYTLSG